MNDVLIGMAAALAAFGWVGLMMLMVRSIVGSLSRTRARCVPRSRFGSRKTVPDARTPCCRAAITKMPSGLYVVAWNPYNGVVQCHACGNIYIPEEDGDYGIGLWSLVSPAAAEAEAHYEAHYENEGSQ